jgi:ankyrin repeat protein
LNLPADKRGNTPLHLAAFNDNGLMVTYLLDRGADVNVKTVEGVTPLHYAAYKGHLANMVALCQKGLQVGNESYPCWL